VHLSPGDAALWLIAVGVILIFCFGTNVIS